jgi:hypothetical protein
MDISIIYGAKLQPRIPIPEALSSLISKLKISFKPAFRRPFVNKHREREPVESTNWRESALADVVRKVREKDDPDYDEINAIINKLSKQTYEKLMAEILLRLEKRDGMFRLRVTTLLFDRGIRQNFYAPMMADVYRDIAAVIPDALLDLQIQCAMFDTLYDNKNVTHVPSSEDPGFNDAMIAWTKQKETKRGFAVYLAELYSRNLVPEATMAAIVKTVIEDLHETIITPKTPMKEEHVDALVRFLFAVVPKLPALKDSVKEILAIPKVQTPCLNMKSRFKLEDSLK